MIDASDLNGTAPRRVLLIEDSPGDARLVRLMLDEADGQRFEVVHVDSLAGAWDCLGHEGASCVLVDLSLPDADGLEAVERLRAVAPELPIIVLTGRNDLGLAVAALQIGAQDYLIKGRVDGQLLTRALRYAIERKHSEMELIHQALHDPLTGLPNRALFVDRLEQALVRNSRRPAMTAVLFVDLDRFKVVNDSLGHAAGDRVLVGLAERLISLLRPSDTVARFGGDEFTVLCADMQSETEAFAIAERIQQALTAPFDLDGAGVVLTASIGIAMTSGDAEAATTLIRNADAAMYRAKERGRAGWLLFDDAIHRRAVQRLQTEVSLRASLETGDFRLYYQPMVDADRDGLAGFEALARWRHPSRGLLMPSEFIPLAEETGLIEPLGAWVLREACAQAQRWRVRGEADRSLLMSVNVSARQLTSDAITDVVRCALAESGLPPDCLCVEITESALIRDVDITLAALEALHETGVRIAVDDFGTGYTTLRNLKRFPIDLIKIDRSFVSGLGHDRGDRAITMAVIRLAHALGVRTVAEGVESGEQLELLRTMGCDVMQGFYIGTPRPAEAAMAAWRGQQVPA
ncbi:MAG TPA: EAL domain-containing protein [Candidatus Dormibacteraeota bacterium]|nr:EAL domain-containing protein [Candidatus Dormibacteraeota bacterium]